MLASNWSYANIKEYLYTSHWNKCGLVYQGWLTFHFDIIDQLENQIADDVSYV